MDSPTPLAQAVSRLLGEPVAEYIRRRRSARKVSLRDIADELHEQTGVRVTPTTVMTWAKSSDGGGPESTSDVPAEAS